MIENKFRIQFIFPDDIRLSTDEAEDKFVKNIVLSGLDWLEQNSHHKLPNPKDCIPLENYLTKTHHEASKDDIALAMQHIGDLTELGWEGYKKAKRKEKGRQSSGITTS